MSKEQKVIIWSIGVFLGLLAFVIFNPVRIIDAGERAVVLRWGEVNRTLQPGFNFIVPISEKIIRFEVRTQKYEIGASSASKDLQTVETTIALNFNLKEEAVQSLYEEVGTQFMERIVFPAIQDSVKASTALFNAEALITRRSDVKNEIQSRLTERLNRRFIDVSDVSIVDFQFSREFDKAIEAKVTAEQRALESENKLKQVEFEAQQRIEQARGEAEAIKIQAQAITQQGGKDYVQLQTISKWDGKLPEQWVPGSAVPFLQLNQY